MYRIKTTDFFSNSGINKNLTDIDVIENISDDSFISKFHNLYVIYSFKCKIEFCFRKDSVIQYIMIEENCLDEKIKNPKCEFIDDMYIFRKSLEKIEGEFNVKINSNDLIKIDDLELHFSEGKIDSLYYFPNGSV